MAKSENEHPEMIPAYGYDYVRYGIGYVIQDVLENDHPARAYLEGLIHEQDTKFRKPRWLP